MPARTKNRGLIFLRRSSGRQESSLQVQLEWALRAAAAEGVRIEASLADLEHMQRKGLHSYKDVRLDDAISGADLERAGLGSLKADATADKAISHIYLLRRDRLARPEDAQFMVLWEKELRWAGITFVMSDKIGKPLDRGLVDIGEEISMWIDYYESGEFLRKHAERVIAAKILLGKAGYWTGGRAPFGFVRVLVDSAGNVLEELADGKKVRQQGCHVRIMPKDLEKLAVWTQILELKLKGWGGRRIALYLNELGIPSPDAGRARTDQGAKHLVSGKWNARSVLELARNPAILGVVQLGRRSDGTHRRIGKEGARLLTERDRNENDRPRLVYNDRADIISGATGFEPQFDARKWLEINAQMDVRGKSQKNVARAKDPARYPLAGRVVDLSNNCGSIMYGRPYGDRRVFTCGRYMRTKECQNHSIDADALLTSTIEDLKRAALLAVGRGGLRRRLEKLAQSRAQAGEVSRAEKELKLLETRRNQLNADLENVDRRMARERNDELYAVLANQRQEMVRDLKEIDARLATARMSTSSQSTPDEDVEAALQLFDDIRSLGDDESSRLAFRDLADRMGIRIGLWFGPAIKGRKRVVRRLLGGVTKFGDDELPVPLFGSQRIDGPSKPCGEPGGDENCAAMKDHCSQAGVVTASEASASQAAPPGPSDSRQEGISYTMVSRGDMI